MSNKNIQPQLPFQNKSVNENQEKEKRKLESNIPVTPNKKIKVIDISADSQNPTIEFIESEPSTPVCKHLFVLKKDDWHCIYCDITETERIRREKIEKERIEKEKN